MYAWTFVKITQEVQFAIMTKFKIMKLLSKTPQTKDNRPRLFTASFTIDLRKLMTLIWIVFKN